MQVDDKYSWLINSLYKYEKLSFEEIQELWEKHTLKKKSSYSLRTFHLHRKIIRENYKIDIQCDRKDGYRYYIANLAETFNKSRQNWEFCTKILNDVFERSLYLEKNTYYPDISNGIEYLTKMAESEREGKQFLITYQPFGKRTKTCTFELLGLKFLHDKWYIIGLDRHTWYRSIAMESIKKIEYSGSTTCSDPYFDINEIMKYCIGAQLPEERRVERVVLRFWKPYKDVVKEKPFHPSQKEECETDTFKDYSYQLYVTEELVDELILLGDAVEVRYPDELRFMLLGKINKIRNRYLG